MDLKHIETFLKVIEKESFSIAADELFTTQPTVSIRIQQLERVLDTQLFQRISGKKVTLTEAGELILPYFREAFKLIQQGTNVLQENKIGQKRFTISSPNYMGVEILPALLDTLFNEFPNIEFTVKVMVTDELIENIRNGELDMGFAYLNNEKKSEGLVNVRVAKEENLLVCKPDHPLTKLGPLKFTDLAEERIIIYNRTFPTTKIIEQHFQRYCPVNVQMVEVSHIGWTKMMLRKGMGIAFLQRMTVQDELLSGKLVELPLAKPLPPTPIYLVFRSSVPEKIKQAATETARKLFMQTGAYL